MFLYLLFQYSFFSDFDIHYYPTGYHIPFVIKHPERFRARRLLYYGSRFSSVQHFNSIKSWYNQNLQAEDGQSESSKTNTSELNFVRVCSTSSTGLGRRTSRASSGLGSSGASTFQKSVFEFIRQDEGTGLDCLTGGRGSSRTASCASNLARNLVQNARNLSLSTKGLAAGEELVVTVLEALGVRFRLLGASVTLVTLCSAFVGLQDLRSVGAGDTNTLRTAGNVFGGTRCEAAGLGGGGNAGSAGGRACNNGRLVLGKSEDANSEREEDGRVLHCDCFGQVIPIGLLCEGVRI